MVASVFRVWPNWALLAVMLVLFGARPLVAADSSASSTIYTNYKDAYNVREGDTIRAFPVPIGIYDVGYIVYTKEFAERFGYPDTYIAPLDKGMQALEFRMYSNGGKVECHLNTLIDNRIGLDLPPQDYTNRFEQSGDMMRFPKQPKDFKERPDDKAFRINVRQDKWHYYSRNIMIGSYRTNNWHLSLMLEGYSNKYIRGLDYISINLGCADLVYDRLMNKDLSVWLKKKGGDDYTKVIKPKPEQFIKFPIPENFAQKAAAAMQSYLKMDYHFFDVLKKE